MQGSEKKHVPRLKFAGLLIGVGLAVTSTSASALAEDDHDQVTCDQVNFQVNLGPDQPQTYNLVGHLCSRGPVGNRTLQVLVAGITYNSSYWNWPQVPLLYSYVDYATAAGFATLAIDRLGTGQSDRPDGLALTSQANVYALHQVIQAVRSGTLTSAHCSPVTPRKVILVGHSLGSMIAGAEIAQFNDVDAFINSGYTHTVGPGFAFAPLDLYPVQDDPKFSSQNYPEGYLTTVPGTRSVLFYDPLDAMASVIAFDEATKDTLTLGEFGDFDNLFAQTLNDHVPTLLVVGDRDALFCGSPSCSQANTLADEGNFYPADAHLQTFILPEAGHSINLHENAFEWFLVAQFWAAAHIGAHP